VTRLLPGNDDLGTMSAWLVWADPGLYPEIPCVGGLVLAWPLVPRSVVHLPGGRVLRIDAPGAGASMSYIHGMTVRGHPYTRTFVPLSVLAPGGEIQFGRFPGQTATPDGNPVERRATYPDPTVPVGALIGRIGNGTPFGIGTQTQPLVMPASGRLMLGVNDNDLEDA